ncbi:MAG: rRNA synthase [Candidatus Sumerlaeota bacterium]|nr:rRNA synthase [Candidatus Sumerlaeota bacterium]
MARTPLPQKLHEFPWSAEWSGRRLKDVLREALPMLSSRDAVMVVANGLVRLGDETATDLDQMLIAQVPMTIDLRHGVRGEQAPKKPRLIDQFRVLHEDRDIVVVAKAAGVVVNPDEETERRGGGPPLVELLKHYWKAKKEKVDNPVLIHRLDKETSGLMVLARTMDAARILQKHAAGRRMERQYLAVVYGVVEEDKGTWRSWIGQGEDGYRQNLAATAEEAPKGAQEAVTHFRVRERLARATVLELRLETGRTHQIRIHCAEAGHPVLGDYVYGALAKKRRPALVAALKDFRVPRMMLHAARLKFEHPANENRWLTFRDEAPQEISDLIEREKSPIFNTHKR